MKNIIKKAIKNKRGITLIELIVTIGLIVIMAGLMIPIVSSSGNILRYQTEADSLSTTANLLQLEMDARLKGTVNLGMDSNKYTDVVSNTLLTQPAILFKDKNVMNARSLNTGIEYTPLMPELKESYDIEYMYFIPIIDRLKQGKDSENAYTSVKVNYKLVDKKTKKYIEREYILKTLNQTKAINFFNRTYIEVNKGVVLYY